MNKDFYDKIAKQFGQYHTGAKHVQDYPRGDPEVVFKQKLLEYSGKDKVTLDIGCADGRFSIAVASNFKKLLLLIGLEAC